MNVNIEELITLNYELEGLLYMVLHRGESTPEKVWELIAEKVHGLSEGIAEHAAPKVAVDEPLVIDAPQETPLPVEEPVTQEELSIAVESTAQEESTAPEILPAQEELPVPEETAITPAAKTTPTEAPKATPSFTEPTVKEPKTEEPIIRLDEKLARETSKDLKKAFSLNDRFRFRRELFSNNENNFTDAINMIEAMSSYDEAQDYFYNDLQWDKNSPEVQDFMAIVEHHFA